MILDSVMKIVNYIKFEVLDIPLLKNSVKTQILTMKFYVTVIMTIFDLFRTEKNRNKMVC